MDFNTIFDRLMQNEGGYSNRDIKEDPGGETNRGITWPFLREGIALGLVPPETTIKGLTLEQAKTLYQVIVWERNRCDLYAPAIAWQFMDAAVNHGPDNAVRMMQTAAGVAPDGHMGPVTYEALEKMSVTDVLILFIAARIDFYTRLSTWAANGKGWMRRMVADLKLAAEDS